MKHMEKSVLSFTKLILICYIFMSINDMLLKDYKRVAIISQYKNNHLKVVSNKIVIFVSNFKS